AASGGSLAHRQDADYLFSSDANHPDTRRIHESLDYLEGRATVFHSRYLSAWASSGAGAKPSVVLGHFILPPACLQEGQGTEEENQTQQGLVPYKHSLLGPNENLEDEPEAERKGHEEEAEDDALDLDESKEETGSRAPARGEFPYRALQEYPLNNMVTGNIWHREIFFFLRSGKEKKYTGELRDFTPGTSGYAAYWIQNGISLHSEAKALPKRKL
ncbi:TERB2 protein, partial [Nycticryphes semicollaris]|nr:TERB2 protein [Nycticryphes semicollaris]